MCRSGCDIDVPELGDTYSEPKFGSVQNGATVEDAFFIGGGYSSDNTKGRAVIVVGDFDGGSPAIIKEWNNSTTTGMDYSIPSTVKVIDEDNNGIIDKIYVGDLGGQMWRFGKFTEADDITPLTFPNCNEDISTWTGERLFNATNVRKIYYPPSVTLENGFDMVFFGTGDRDDACNDTTNDRIYAVKDVHASWDPSITLPLTETDIVDITDPTDPLYRLPVLPIDNGFYLRLNQGEKVMSEGIVFYNVLYMTTFTPDASDPCMPGGVGKLYALSYLTGEAVIDFTGDDVEDRSVILGGGIPSKPVMVIPPGDTPATIIISVGSTLPDADSEEDDAGPLTVPPNTPNLNFFYLWWKILTD
jgi:type IV pilus assembly protein PilY1